VASRFTSIFRLGRHGNETAVTKELADERLDTLNRADETVNYCGLLHEDYTAKAEVNYFTCLVPNDDDYLWRTLDVWERFIPDIEVVEASEEWVAAVYKGLGKSHDDAKRSALQAQRPPQIRW